jgi:hypothetical protein
VFMIDLSGMTMYEIVSLGDTPYSDLDDLQTLRTIEEGIKPNLYVCNTTALSSVDQMD